MAPQRNRRSCCDQQLSFSAGKVNAAEFRCDLRPGVSLIGEASIDEPPNCVQQGGQHELEVTGSRAFRCAVLAAHRRPPGFSTVELHLWAWELDKRPKVGGPSRAALAVLSGPLAAGTWRELQAGLGAKGQE